MMSKQRSPQYLLRKMRNNLTAQEKADAELKYNVS